jgi:riboflavin synthase
MFTGIITAIGEVRERSSERLVIAAEPIAADLKVGGSIAVNGVCLTAVSIDQTQGQFGVELSPETLRRTNLGSLRPGDRVNLELPLRLGDRLGGHLVQGHVDALGEVVSIEPQGEFYLFTFRVDPAHEPLLVEKGSIAIDGVSLTPFHIWEGRFEVAVIPHTLRATTLQGLQPGDKVNIEFDILAKYVTKLMKPLREGGQR